MFDPQNRSIALLCLPEEISGCDSRVCLSPSFKVISSFVQMKFIPHFHFLAERNPIRDICADNYGLCNIELQGRIHIYTETDDIS